jgi:hypothetical protein
MSQVSIINNKVFPSFAVVQSLTGDIGGVVSPDVFNNINLLGGINIQVVGTPLTNTLAVALNPNITLTSVTAGDFYTDTVVAHMNISDNSIIAVGTNPDIDIEIRPKGTGDLNVSNGSIRVDAFGMGVVLSDAIGVLNSLIPGAVGTVLTSRGAVLSPTWQAVSVTGLTPHALVLGSNAGTINQIAVGGTGRILIGVAANDPTWTTTTYPSTTAIGDILVASGANVIGVVAGAAATTGHVLTAINGAAPTFQAPVIWMTKTNAIANVAPAAVNTAYTINHGTPANLLTVTLPAVAAVGDRVEIIGNTAGMWSLVAAAGDVINHGNLATAAGGSVSASHRYDTVEVVCTVANDTWVVSRVNGILNVV